MQAAEYTDEVTDFEILLDPPKEFKSVSVHNTY